MSAENTARSTLAAVRGDGVRAVQHVLYRAARADPDRRFHALRDKVYRQGSRYPAWRLLERVTGAPPDHRPLVQGLRRKYGELYGL